MPERMATRITIPVHEDDGNVSATKSCTFQSKTLGRTDLFPGEWIFECTEGGSCHGCGCPSFKLEAVDGHDTIPEEIMDHLRWHAEVCPGLFPVTAPSQGQNP